MQIPKDVLEAGGGRIAQHQADYHYSSQPTGPGCQRKTPWSVHTNDPVNLGSGPEFWLQFANAVEFWNKHGDELFIVPSHRCFG